MIQSGSCKVNDNIYTLAFIQVLKGDIDSNYTEGSGIEIDKNEI